MTFKKLAAAIAFAASLALPASAAEYAFDIKGQHASIDFRVKHLGYSWLTGRFDKFDGTFFYDEAKPEASWVKVDIDVASISSNHGERDKHLRGPDYLDVDQFPKASFESTAVKLGADGKGTIEGTFNIRGKALPVTINVEKVGGGPDPWGGERLGFTGTTELKMPDLAFKKQLGPASQSVFLRLDVEGIKKK